MWPVVGWILLDGLVADGGVGIPISMIHQRTVSHSTLCHTVLCVTQYCVTQCCVTQYILRWHKSKIEVQHFNHVTF